VLSILGVVHSECWVWDTRFNRLFVTRVTGGIVMRGHWIYDHNVDCDEGFVIGSSDAGVRYEGSAFGEGWFYNMLG